MSSGRSRRLWSRLGFRGQLVVMIAGAFVIGGAVLLAAQYAVLRTLLSQQATLADEGRAAAAESVTGGAHRPTDEASVLVESHLPAWMSDPVVRSVLGGVQAWSAVLLLLFTVLAVGGAWFVSRRALHRISELTDAANAITEHDLSQRLDVDGPDDEIKRLGGAFDGMIERLEAAFERQRAFVANASHELRTPLATTRTVLQVAMRQGRVPDGLRPEIEDALEANQRLEELVSALLVIAQARAEAALPREPVELGGLLVDVLRDHEAEADERGVALRSELPGAPLLVPGNRALLRSMLSNLVVNAIRHGDGRLITVSLRDAGDEACIVVENTGAPLDPVSIERLVQPFERGDRSRTRAEGAGTAPDGVGLGLALVDGVVALHSGMLSLAPRRSGGLVARITLPSA